MKRIFASLFAALAICAAGRAGAAASPSPSPVAADADQRGLARAHTSAAAPLQPAFRLGTAARPFGWSTAIGDFNQDGTPDVVVADHVGRRANGYTYRLEFSLSGAAPADVFFESTADALTITTVDIDHDNDLDIVARRPMNGGTVGVWLNDGHGHFTAADIRSFPSAIGAHQRIDAGDQPADAGAVDASPRPQQSRMAALGAGASDAGDRANASAARLVPPTISVRRASPRGPPLT